MNAIDTKREELMAKIKADVEANGVWKCDTCAGGESFGWDMPAHYALQQIQRRGLPGIALTYIIRHECHEWTATAA